MTTTQPVDGSVDRRRVDDCLEQLDRSQVRLCALPAAQRVGLIRASLAGLLRASGAWVDHACRAKGIDPMSGTASEEIAAGPMATARFLRLLGNAIDDSAQRGHPRIPGRPTDGPEGRLRVPVFPTRSGMHDSLLFGGFRAHTWLEGPLRFGGGAEPDCARPAGPVLVLGAGNVSSIAPSDALGKIFLEGKTVLLKTSPVNAYMGPILRDVFSPVIEAGFLQVIQGGAETGAYAVDHELVREVHITGSAAAYDAIVWGASVEERERRKREGRPRLDKPITSELGNVTPWIVVPGPYTDRQLEFQAENLAAMITNNASFNCVAVKMIITWVHWEQRGAFLEKLRRALASVAPRMAYYPGAVDRYRRWAGREPPGNGTLPWTLLEDTHPRSQPQLFREESFVAVTAETALGAAGPQEFLARAVDFANNELWGTLAAGVMVHPSSRRGRDAEHRFQIALARLRYGTVAVNHWPGLAFATMSCPWGGYPGSSLTDVQSGTGWVHNVYCLQGIEKTVLEGPLVSFPKPLWFSSHRRSRQLAWRVVDFYGATRCRKLPGIFADALRG
jgi:acyl-CoA reductase-like NAD-dependent aldehyde dehydrogenase